MSDDAAVRQEGTPLVAKCYIAAVVVAAIAVLWWLSHHEIVVRPLDTFVLLAILVVFLESSPLTLSYEGEPFYFSFGTPFAFAMLTIFGVLPAIVVQLIASVVATLVMRKPWSRIAFNAAQFVVALAAAGVVLEMLLGEPIVYPGMSFGLGQLPALLLMLLVFFLVNNLLVGTIIELVTGWDWKQVFKRTVSQDSFMEASTLLLVPVVAVSMRHSPALGVFLVVPIGALSRATKVAMENVTLLESQAVALEEKHAAEETAREREAAREAADRANKAKSHFLSQMSHELRTPLNAVLGFAQLLNMDPLTSEQKDSTAEIMRAGEHLLELINEVLDISSIEAGGARLSLEPVDAVHTVKECISLLTPMADQAGLGLHLVGVADECVYVTADRQRLKQVVLNLISNGIKYNRQGGSVRVSIGRTEGGVEIDVTDTGRGIPVERMDQLFAPFERLGAEGSDIEGTGLGLALSKGLVEAMGGTISVASVVERGSTFSVELASAEDGSTPRGEARS